MTKEEKLIVSAYTGTLMTDFNDFVKFVEEKLGRVILTHELGDKNVQAEIKRSVREDFFKLID